MRIIDLSQSISDGMKVYSGDPEVKVEVVHNYEQEGWLLRSLSLGSHTATHVDAFSHMDPQGEDLDQIPLDRFCGRAYLVSSTEEWPEGVGLIFNEELDIQCLDKILAAKPPFIGARISVELEVALLNHKIVTYTGLRNLELLPKGQSFIFYGLPLKIKAGDGSPVRAIAILSD